MAKRLRKHYKVEYGALINAINRCTNPRNAQFKDYGGRGIKVHSDFLGPQGFWNFLNEIGSKPSPELTLDRISNDKGYEPGNVAWATRKHQSANRRPKEPRRHDLGWGTSTITFNRCDGKKQTIISPIIPLGDESKCLKEWAEILGVSQRTLRQRFYRGLTPEQALIPGLFDNWGKPRNDGPTIH